MLSRPVDTSPNFPMSNLQQMYQSASRAQPEGGRNRPVEDVVAVPSEPRGHRAAQ